MNEYRKISKDNVLHLMIEVHVNTMNPIDIISVPTIARFLQTSTYQVRKNIKELVAEGLVIKDSFVPPLREHPLPCNGYRITSKAYDLEYYKQCTQEEYERLQKHFFSEEGDNDL